MSCTQPTHSQKAHNLKIVENPFSNKSKLDGCLGWHLAHLPFQRVAKCISLTGGHLCTHATLNTQQSATVPGQVKQKRLFRGLLYGGHADVLVT